MVRISKKVQKNVFVSAHWYIYIPVSLNANTGSAEKINIKFRNWLALDISLQQCPNTKNWKCYSKFETITKNYNVPFFSGHFSKKIFFDSICLDDFTLLVATTE